MAEKNERAIKVVAENRKARFNYAIEDTIEAGISLTGMGTKATVLNCVFPNMNVINVRGTNDQQIFGNLIRDLTIVDTVTTAATPLDR